jgi:hypothetical protein
MAYNVLRLGERPGLRHMARWMHMLGFRGHFVTKSRGYSTNLGTLRAERAAYRATQDEPDELVEDAESMAMLSFWEHRGSGYLIPATRSWPPASGLAQSRQRGTARRAPRPATGRGTGRESVTPRDSLTGLSRCSGFRRKLALGRVT